MFCFSDFEGGGDAGAAVEAERAADRCEKIISL